MHDNREMCAGSRKGWGRVRKALLCQGARHPQRPRASRHRRQEILCRIEFFPIKCRIQNAKDNFRLYQDDLVRGNGFWRSKPGQGPKIKVAPPSPPRRCLRRRRRPARRRRRERTEARMASFSAVSSAEIRNALAACAANHVCCTLSLCRRCVAETMPRLTGSPFKRRPFLELWSDRYGCRA